MVTGWLWVCLGYYGSAEVTLAVSGRLNEA